MNDNLGFFIGLLILVGFIWLAPGFITALLSKVIPSEEYVISSIIIHVIFGVLLLVVRMGLTRIALRFCDNERGRFTDLFSCFPLFFKFLIGLILYSLIILVGTLLLIIPGIIWAIQFRFFEYLIVDKGLGPIEALRKSAAITKGAKWDLFLLDLLFTLLHLLGGICLLVGLFATIPTTTVAMAFVYRKLLVQMESAGWFAAPAEGVVLYAFMAQAAPAGPLAVFNQAVMLSSEQNLKELVRSRADAPNAEVVIIPPEQWNPPRLESATQSELAAKSLQILARVLETLRRLRMPTASLERLFEDSFVLSSSLTGLILFVFRVPRLSPMPRPHASGYPTLPRHRPRGAVFIALLGLLLLAVGLLLAYALYGLIGHIEDRSNLFAARLVYVFSLVIGGALLFTVGICLRRTVQGKLTVSHRWPFLVLIAFGVIGAGLLVATVASPLRTLYRGSTLLSAVVRASPTPTPITSPTATPEPSATPTLTPSPTATPRPTATPTPRRLVTGTFLEDNRGGGHGELTIKNYLNNQDAVAILTPFDSTSPVFAVYITANGALTIPEIDDGLYHLYFSLGEDWDSQQKKFTRKVSRKRFEEPLSFETSETSLYIQYTSIEVTLYAVPEGGASTIPVSEAEFPDLSR
jgi:hypothetical protein